MSLLYSSTWPELGEAWELQGAQPPSLPVLKSPSSPQQVLLRHYTLYRSGTEHTKHVRCQTFEPSEAVLSNKVDQRHGNVPINDLKIVAVSLYYSIRRAGVTHQKPYSIIHQLCLHSQRDGCCFELLL